MQLNVNITAGCGIATAALQHFVSSLPKDLHGDVVPDPYHWLYMIDRSRRPVPFAVSYRPALECPWSKACTEVSAVTDD